MADRQDNKPQLRLEEERSGGGCCGGGCGGERQKARAVDSAVASGGPSAAAFLLAARLAGFPSENIDEDLASLGAILAKSKDPVPATAEWEVLAPLLTPPLVADKRSLDALRSTFVDELERSAGGEQNAERGAAAILASSLEYYGLLLIRQAILAQDGDRAGGELLLEARRTHLDEYLGWLVLQGIPTWNENRTQVFGPAAAWVRALVDEECARLGVEPRAENEEDDDESEWLSAGTIQESSTD